MHALARPPELGLLNNSSRGVVAHSEFPVSGGGMIVFGLGFALSVLPDSTGVEHWNLPPELTEIVSILGATSRKDPADTVERQVAR